jgi:phage terminase small subunit
MSKLTAKQRAFVDAYLVDLNATQAAIRAGYSAKTAKQAGSRLLTNVDVAAAVAAAQERRARRVEITQDEVLANLEAARTGAMGEAQYAAAIRACELQGKHLGMFVDRQHLSGPDGGPIPVASAQFGRAAFERRFLEIAQRTKG